MGRLRALSRAGAALCGLNGGAAHAQRQLLRLRALMRRSWTGHPAQARWWQEYGLAPGWLPESLEDLSRLPIITKQHYQALAPEEVVGPAYRGQRLLTDLTSGSTAAPLAIRRTFEENYAMCAYRLRAMFERGMRWNDRRAAFETGIAPMFKLDTPKAPKAWMRIGVLPRVVVNHVQLKPEGVLRRLQELRPQILTGHAEGLWRFATEAPEAEVRALGLRFVTAGAQTVTPEMAARMRQAFGCPVYNMYGASEFNLLAAECGQSGLLHLNEAGLIVEVLRDGQAARDGEGGEVVATNLDTEAMPLIRYALNDWAVMGPPRCPCGYPARTLRSVQGRVAEFFHFSGGRKEHPFELINPLLGFVGWIKEYRMVQAERDRIEVWFDVFDGAPADAEQQVAAAVGAKAPADVVVRAMRRAVPPLAERGKNAMFQALGAEP